MPTFNLNGFMFISKCSHDDGNGGDWKVNLSLTDYPPDLGEKPSKSTDSSKSDS